MLGSLGCRTRPRRRTVELGLAYSARAGVRQDVTEAARWLRLAAEQGHAEAQNRLGFCYGRGEGVPADPVEAVRWFRMAAEQGHSEAQSNLERMAGERGDAEGSEADQFFGRLSRWLRRVLWRQT